MALNAHLFELHKIDLLIRFSITSMTAAEAVLYECPPPPFQEPCSIRYMWVSGPIATVPADDFPVKLAAAAKIRASARKWFTEANQ
jgi:hypothetical protein